MKKGPLFLALLIAAAAPNLRADQDKNQSPAATPAPAATAKPSKSSSGTGTANALTVHKPMPSPSWGKVVQYRREQVVVTSDKSRETLHEFVFQDEDGVVRTALFHESPSGEGYWEVWVWDQP